MCTKLNLMQTGFCWPSLRLCNRMLAKDLPCVKGQSALVPVLNQKVQMCEGGETVVRMHYYDLMRSFKNSGLFVSVILN